MGVESGIARVNNTSLWYEVAGEGPPLVLIHGFSLDSRMWDAQFAAFARERRVVRYDLRGFGRSALPGTEPFGHHEDLNALLAYLGIRQADVLGLSLGGMVAIDFALAYPDTARSLVPVDALFSGYRFSQDWDERTGLVWELAREFGVEAAKASWLDHPLFAPLAERPEAAACVRRMVGEYSGWHVINDNPARSPRPPAAERLRDLAMPLLVIVGERDLPDFQRMAEMLATEAPLARRVVIPGAGHMASMEDPAAFNRLLLDFLRTLPASGPSLGPSPRPSAA